MIRSQLAVFLSSLVLLAGSGLSGWAGSASLTLNGQTTDTIPWWWNHPGSGAMPPEYFPEEPPPPSPNEPWLRPDWAAPEPGGYESQGGPSSYPEWDHPFWNALSPVSYNLTSDNPTGVANLTGDFGVSKTGQALRRGFVFRNYGLRELSIRSITLTGEAFSADIPSPDLSAGRYLAVGQWVAFSINFNSSSPGVHHGELRIEVETIADGPIEVVLPLVGESVEKLPFEVAAAVEFPPVPLGGKATRFITVTNHSATWPLTVYTPIGADSFGAPAGSHEIPPGHSKPISVNFEPATVGSHSGEITLTGKLGLAPFTEKVAARGEGIVLPLAFADMSILGPGPKTSFSAFRSHIYMIEGLPPGLFYDHASGSFWGRPTVAGTYTATAVLRTEDFQSAGTQTFTIKVEDLPAKVRGSYVALVTPPDPPQTSKLELGGWVDLRTHNSDGAYSADLFLGGEKYMFSGWFSGDVASVQGYAPFRSTTNVEISSGIAYTVELELWPGTATQDPTLTGSISHAGQSAAIRPSCRTIPSARPFWPGQERRLHIAFSQADETAGQGYAVLTLSKKNTVKWDGVLPDGQKFSGDAMVFPNGELLFYSVLPYKNGGSLGALIKLESRGGLLQVKTPDGSSSGFWRKRPATAPNERALRNGVNTVLGVYGAEYRLQWRGQRAFGASEGFPLEFSLAGAELNAHPAMASYAEDNYVVLPATMPTLRSIKVSHLTLSIRPTLNLNAGTAKGSVVLTDRINGKNIRRTLAYQGLYIPNLEDPEQSNFAGFFLFPELPAPGQAPAKADLQSGVFLLHGE